MRAAVHTAVALMAAAGNVNKPHKNALDNSQAAARSAPAALNNAVIFLSSYAGFFDAASVRKY